MRRCQILAHVCLFFLFTGKRLYARPVPQATAKQSGTIAAPMLDTVSAVHHLSVQAATAHPSVVLRGVVTYLSAKPKVFYLQDRTGGISVVSVRPLEVSQGDQVEISGTADPGRFAPIARATHIRVVGRGKMPASHLQSYSRLVGGGEDSAWLAIRGVVRSARVVTAWSRQVLSLTVDADGGLIAVQLSRYSLGDADRLVDATVEMEGVCTTAYNEKRQFTGVRLNVPSMDFVHVEDAPHADPFTIPFTPIPSLLQYEPDRHLNHRRQIMGTVTYQDLGHLLYLQEGADGILVATTQETILPLGTRVAAIGFPVSGAYSPVLHEASFRPLWPGTPVTPKNVSAADLLHKGEFLTAPFNSQLLHLQGQVVETVHRSNDTSWLIREGENHFVALLPEKLGVVDTPAIRNGTIVAVTGVLSVQVDESGKPNMMRILLRSPSDLTVIKNAPWWTPGHTLAALSLVLAATLVIALWGTLLRRTVRKQTRMLRESEERFRRQAQQDALTGLCSRLFLQEQLQRAIDAVPQTGIRPGLLMIDLDHFKQVNDTLGHHAGDRLLCIVAARILAVVRQSDAVARMGGDEFVVLLKDLQSVTEARLIGAKIVASVAAPIQVADSTIHVSASVGVCLYPEGGTTCDVLLQNVDAAMYQAKAAGRNSFSLYRDVEGPMPPATARVFASVGR